jgi:hypothetical protein
MPVAHRIEASLRVVFSTLHGVVTADEIRIANQELLDAPAFESSFRQLVDNRRITELVLTAEDIQALADISPFGEGSRRAFVVGDSLVHFGMARQFALARHWVDEVNVFRSMPEARRWLGIAEPPGLANDVPASVG